MFKKLNIIVFAIMIALGFHISSGWSEEVFMDDYVEYDNYSDNVVGQSDAELADQMSVQALQEYDMTGSLFEKITMLEQEKVVAQLEKERAQLDLDFDRLNAERIKLQMELDTLSGRAEQDYEPIVKKSTSKKEEGSFNRRYKLINVVGVDNQLQATVQEVSTGQNKRIAVGKDLDGYVVKSISLNDGIIFEKDGVEESLNIGK